LVPYDEVVINSGGVDKVTDYMKRMINQQSAILQIAQRHLKEVHDRRATLNERRHANEKRSTSSGHEPQVPEYKVDDFVLLAWPSPGPPDKLKHNLRGPYKVVTVKPNHLVIQSLINYREYEYHKSLFIPFSYDPAVVNPSQVAYKDQSFFEIDNCQDVRGPLNKNKSAFLRKEVEVLVKWSHIEEPQWELYANVRDTEQFHKFIKDKYRPHDKEYKLLPNKFIQNGVIVPG
jgi:hypothetical protein